jgi:hypothetical protein
MKNQKQSLTPENAVGGKHGGCIETHNRGHETTTDRWIGYGAESVPSRAHDVRSRMPERARTDLWEPQGSNPLGPPGQGLRITIANLGHMESFIY